MKQKKVKNIGRPEMEQKDKKAETITIWVIVLFALVGLALGYLMFQEFSGQEQMEDEQSKKVENEN